MGWVDVTDQWPGCARAYAIQQGGGIQVRVYDGYATDYMLENGSIDLSQPSDPLPFPTPVPDPFPIPDPGPPSLPGMGVGVNIYDTRMNSGGMFTANRAAVKDEILRRLVHLRGHGVDWVRLCLQAHASQPGDAISWADMYGSNADSVYRNNVIEILGLAGEIGMKVAVCPWESPHVPRGSGGEGIPTNESHNWWASFVSDTAHMQHVMYDIANEPQNNYQGDAEDGATDDADRAAMFLGILKTIRENENSLGAHQHMVLLAGLGGWARRSEAWLGRMPPGDTNVAIKQHVYSSWPDEDWTSQAQSVIDAGHKLMIGEFGPAPGYMTLEDCDRLVEWCRIRGVPCAAWAFSNREGGSGQSPIRMLQQYSPGDGVGIDLDDLTPWGDRFISYLP